MAINYNKASLFLTMFALFIGFSNVVLADEYGGSWLLNDTNGSPFEITLSQDGTAAGTHGDAMKHGIWKEEDGAAVIHWDTGWMTRISKVGNKYVKAGFKPGAALTDKPTNISDAKKKE